MMRLFLISTAAVLLGTAFCAFPKLAFADPINFREQGVLEDGDFRLEDNSLFDRFKFTGTAGQQVTITLQSSDFDSFLMLTDLDGNVIAENDDAEGTNSQLIVTLPSSGEYGIIANSYFAAGQGTYTLTVNSQDIPTQSHSSYREQSSDCNVAITQLRRSLAEGRQLGIPYQNMSDAYGDYPDERSLIYVFGIEGPATDSVLNSPQFLTNLSETFINNCSSAAAVSIGRYGSGESVTIGLVNGFISVFRCSEDIGIEPDVNSPPLPWGYEYCSI